MKAVVALKLFHRGSCGPDSFYVLISTRLGVFLKQPSFLLAPSLRDVRAVLQRVQFAR